VTAEDAFSRLTAALDASGVAYMLTGSFASSYHGAPRAPQDIDLVIDPSEAELRGFVALLTPELWYSDLDAALDALARRSMFNIVDLGSGWKIDLILRKDRAFSGEEFARRQAVDFLGRTLFIASAEDVVLSKLEWARDAESQRQIADAAGILRIRQGELDDAYLDRWARDLGVIRELAEARRP
jgi:hypothetical protein